MDSHGIITQAIGRCKNDWLLEGIHRTCFIYNYIFPSLFRLYIPFHIRQALCDRRVSLLYFNGSRGEKLLTSGILHSFPLWRLLLLHTGVVFEAVPLPNGNE
jgi:hypothetical protein